MDAAPRPFARQGLAQVARRRLGRAINRGCGEYPVGGDRADDDDAAVLPLAAPRRHQPPRALGYGQEDAADIGGEPAGDHFDASAQRKFFGRDAGVRYDRVDWAERGPIRVTTALGSGASGLWEG